MRKVKLSKISNNECQGIQINGLGHCKKISCKWQGLTACEGKNIIKTGYNLLGYNVSNDGVV